MYWLYLHMPTAFWYTLPFLLNPFLPPSSSTTPFVEETPSPSSPRMGRHYGYSFCCGESNLFYTVIGLCMAIHTSFTLIKAPSIVPAPFKPFTPTTHL